MVAIRFYAVITENMRANRGFELRREREALIADARDSLKRRRRQRVRRCCVREKQRDACKNKKCYSPGYFHWMARVGHSRPDANRCAVCHKKVRGALRIGRLEAPHAGYMPSARG